MPTQFEQLPGFKGIFFNNSNGRYYAFVRYRERHNIALGAFTSHVAAQAAFNDEIERLSDRENKNGQWQNSDFVFYKQSSPQYYNHLIEDEIMDTDQHPRITYATGFVGIAILEEQYFAVIKAPGKKISIGPFEDLADAAVAYDLELYMQYDEGQVDRITALNFPHTDYPNVPDRIALASPEYMRELRKKFSEREEEEEVVEVPVPAPIQPTSSSAGFRNQQVVSTMLLPEHPHRFTYANAMNKLGITSVYSGVRKAAQKNRWEAFFNVGDREHYLGRFSSEMEAAERYDQEVHSMYKWLTTNRSAEEANAFYKKFTTKFGFKCNFKKLPSSAGSMLYQHAMATSVAESPYMSAGSTVHEPNNMHMSPGAKSSNPGENMKYLKL